MGAAAALVLAFFLGLVVLAVLAGLAVIGALYLGVMRLVYRFRRRRGPSEDVPLSVEYRVIRREREE